MNHVICFNASILPWLQHASAMAGGAFSSQGPIELRLREEQLREHEAGIVRLL